MTSRKPNEAETRDETEMIEPVDDAYLALIDALPDEPRAPREVAQRVMATLERDGFFTSDDDDHGTGAVPSMTGEACPSTLASSDAYTWTLLDDYVACARRVDLLERANSVATFPFEECSRNGPTFTGAVVLMFVTHFSRAVFVTHFAQAVFDALRSTAPRASHARVSVFAYRHDARSIGAAVRREEPRCHKHRRARCIACERSSPTARSSRQDGGFIARWDSNQIYAGHHGSAILNAAARDAVRRANS